eukprot:ctg_334.g182
MLLRPLYPILPPCAPSGALLHAAIPSEHRPRFRWSSSRTQRLRPAAIFVPKMSLTFITSAPLGRGRERSGQFTATHPDAVSLSFTSTTTRLPRPVRPDAHLRMTLDKRAATTSFPASTAPTPPEALFTPYDRSEFDRYVQNTYVRYPMTLVAGKGSTVWDDHGRAYVDCVAGIATCSLGHADARLLRAVTDQLSRLHHVSNLYYTREQGELAKWIVTRSCADRVFFCNSGAEANEAALKLARKYAHVTLQLDMPYVVTANASFHGRTLATITATGQPKYHRHFEPLMPGFLYTPYNDAAALEELVQKIHAGEVSAPPDAGRVGLAAILLEALQGEGGVRPGDREFFATARRLCDETGALLILDEVQVGVGRTGRMFGFQNLDVEPDVFTLAKGSAAAFLSAPWPPARRTRRCSDRASTPLPLAATRWRAAPA